MTKPTKRLVPKPSFAIPMLIALALHGIFLFLPTDSEPESVEELVEADDTEPAVAEFPQLDTQPPALDLESKIASETAPQLESAPQIATPPAATAPQPSRIPQISVAQPAPVPNYQEYVQQLRAYYQRLLAPRQVSPSRDAVPRQPQRENVQASTPKIAPVSPNPVEQSPVSSPAPKPAEQAPIAARNEPQTATSSSIFTQSFPYYPGSWLTSGGILKPEFKDADYVYYTTDSLEQVATNFESQLTDRAFTETVETDRENFKVYRVSKNGVTQYLHLLEEDGKTAIFLGSDPRNLSEIAKETQNDTVVESSWLTRLKFYFTFKEQIQNNTELPLQPLDFSEAEAPWLKNLQEVDEKNKFLMKNLKAIATPAQTLRPEQLAGTIGQQLNKAGDFELEKVDDYRDGALYEIVNGEFQVYMLLVPTQEEEDRRIAIVFSEEDPRSDSSSQE
ncbi:MAG: hypothetical protein ACFB4I_15945 [Cyanophyceae cyanobacterium]